MIKLGYPPCSINVMTERPYPRHAWEIPVKAKIRYKMMEDGTPIAYYRVRCKRCGFNDPKAPTY